jgi:hypothetical protein
MWPLPAGTKKRAERPSLASATRTTRRATARLYAEDERALADLCEQLELGEGDVIRRALRELAKREGVR